MPELWVAMRRMQEFLLLDNHAQRAINEAQSQPTQQTKVQPLLALSDATIQHTSTSFKLDRVTLALYPGDLIGVSGRVMAGKTTLLEALLGEVPCHGGVWRSASAMAYAGQTPWIFAGSLRDNIVFDTPFEANRYARVIAACALAADIEQLPDGESTDIGEKGVNLSGK